MTEELDKELQERIEEIEESTTLSHRQAQVYVLFHGEGLSHPEVAEKIGISPGNSSSKWQAVKRKVEEAEEEKWKLDNTAKLF